MLKALIVGADSVEPGILFQARGLFPTLSKMVEQGASAAYSAYVQKGYKGSYSSEQNWASIYTGLAPDEHKINTNTSRGEPRSPQMQDFNTLEPFWKVLNENGFRVGLWAADNCTVPQPIDGYVISAKYQMLSTPVENRKEPREIQLCEKDRHISKYLNGLPPHRQYPKTLSQQGYRFEELKDNPDLAEEAIKKYCFQDALPNFEEEMSYWFEAMKRTQKEEPVDVLYLYTPTTDLIAHCCMCSDRNPVLISAYQILDRYIGKMIEEFAPEITIMLSDHGQQNFKDLIQCSDPQIQREAFAASEQVLWLKNGYVAFEAHNGALLFTAHALKGTFIAVGKGIRHTRINGMRTLDIYPTLLELFKVKIPENRSGYLADIFEEPILNDREILQSEKKRRQSIALLQSHAVNRMDIIINELYIERRFADITIVGEEKYREIFLGNPRVSDFIPFDAFHANNFDDIYCGIYNENSKLINHIKIYERER